MEFSLLSCWCHVGYTLLRKSALRYCRKLTKSFVNEVHHALQGKYAAVSPVAPHMRTDAVFHVNGIMSVLE